MDYEKLGSRIRTYRKKLHFTQEQLSELAGISLSFLGHIERGSRKASLETLISLCNAMKVSPELLLQDSLDPDLLGLPKTKDKREKNLLMEVTDAIHRFYDEDDAD